jgi:hypothetical protein
LLKEPFGFKKFTSDIIVKILIIFSQKISYKREKLKKKNEGFIVTIASQTFFSDLIRYLNKRKSLSIFRYEK